MSARNVNVDVLPFFPAWPLVSGVLWDSHTATTDKPHIYILLKDKQTVTESTKHSTSSIFFFLKFFNDGGIPIVKCKNYNIYIGYYYF